MDTNNNTNEHLPTAEETECSNQFCMECSSSPCIVLQDECSNITEIGETHEAMGKTMKDIRFTLYCYMSKVLHGYLGKGNRRKLPDCITTREVYDSYPKKNGDVYTGFHDA
jgi:hypothetical protein